MELIKLLLNTQKEQVLQRIKEVFEQEEGIDFWDELNAQDQAAINEGIEQLDQGRHVPHESVREEIKKHFNF